MGIDFSGGMLVGYRASSIEWNYDNIYEDYSDSLEEGETLEDLESHKIAMEVLGMNSYSEYFDCGEKHQYWGYPMPDVVVNDPSFEEWLCNVKETATKFERYTNNKAELIGTQDIY